MARHGRGPELVVFGEFYVDLVFCRLGVAPAWGVEVRAQEYTEAPGGGVATTALTARRLGAGVSVITRVGPDAVGHPAWRMLAAAGVDASASEVRLGMSTARSACVAFNGDRMIITHDPINRDLEAVLRRRPALALMRRARHVHFACALRQPARIRPVLEDLAARGVTCSADMGWNPDTLSLDHLRPLLPWLPMLLPNAAEAERLTGEADPAAACLRLAEVVRWPVVKCGAQGSVMVAPAANGQPRLWRAPAAKAHVVDATGAGDAFNGGFLHGYLRGWSWRECLRLGNRCGARAVAAAGGAAGLASLTRADGRRRVARA
ncbi:MAG: carbohydrate kinase family protein [Terriglobales bacterium]